MNKSIYTLFFILLTQVGWTQKIDLIETLSLKDTSHQLFVNTANISSEKWDTLAQPVFWKEVMNLSPDSCIVNIAATRTILGKDSFIDWKKQTEAEKLIYKDSVRKQYDLAAGTKIYVTSGKSHFYQVEGVMASISRGIEVFKEEKTDPWYAQAILLIESPGKIEYSSVGAYGSFQLMASVARDHGLIVNKKVDERTDFVKSARGAASLIRKTCLPEARRILKNHDIEFIETDLWFRLFVLHIYHAGAGNVQGLMKSMQPSGGGQYLITKMWQSEWGGFKNASQNYSQVALASLIRLNNLIYSESDAIFDCSMDLSNQVH